MQIRTLIHAQSGILPGPAIAILEKIGAHPECRFSAAEVYRAAYGDEPMPKNDYRGRHDDDD
ncbi:MAG: hypothetical protein ABIG70_01910 [Pseudomonadota bacterium]